MPTAPKRSLRAPVDALTLPLDQIQWADDPRPKRRRWPALVAAGVIVGVAIPAAARPELGPTPRLAPAGCVYRTVVPGDTVWRIAGDAGLTLDVVAGLNPQIPKLNVIRPGDQIATSCSSNEMAKVQLAPGVSVVNVSKWFDEREPSGQMTWRSIVAYLYNAGFRGDDLLTMAAITPGESARYPFAEGDNTPQYLVNGWQPSVGAWMIRAHSKYEGTGYLRDITKLRTDIGFQAAAAFQLYEAAKARGANPFIDWAAYTNKSWQASDNGVPRVEQARTAAREIGVL